MGLFLSGKDTFCKYIQAACCWRSQMLNWMAFSHCGIQERHGKPWNSFSYSLAYGNCLDNLLVSAKQIYKVGISNFTQSNNALAVNADVLVHFQDVVAKKKELLWNNLLWWCTKYDGIVDSFTSEMLDSFAAKELVFTRSLGLACFWNGCFHMDDYGIKWCIHQGLSQACC